MLQERIRAIRFRSGLTATGLLFLGAFIALVPSAVPFSFFEFWKIDGSIISAVIGAWPLYLFMMGLNAYSLFSKRDNYKHPPSDILIAGFFISIWAGVVEEICFRWLMFFGAIIFIPMLDALLHWITGVHGIRWLYAEVVCPTANFFTLGYLRPLLLDGYGWAVGAAVITANGQFRNGHSYQGFFGFTLAWFFGMYMFWVMFHHGLPAGILIHFTTDLCVFLTIWADARMEARERRTHRNY